MIDSAEREFWEANMNWMFSHVFKVNIDHPLNRLFDNAI